MATSMHRKNPSRASLPRRTTRGPLNDEEDPLSSTRSSPSSASMAALTPGVMTPTATAQDDNPLETTEAQENLLDHPQVETPGLTGKDLSFLLDTSIYHPLSQVDVPPPLRVPLVAAPTGSTTITQAHTRLDALIADCDFLNAAQYAASCLTLGVVQPTDYSSIFKLLAIRYSCLELTGQVLLAAQEAKALEDLSSDFYYLIPQTSEDDVKANDGVQPLPRHIMPFPLRVQAMRLQNIGFSDPRRGVTALYDLGLEVKENLRSPYTSELEREDWVMKLHLLSMHVVNALIELGDVDCAQRTLVQSRPSSAAPLAHQAQWTTRMVLMLVKLGRLKQAEYYINDLSENDHTKTLLISIIAVANGKLDEAAALLQSLHQQEDDVELGVLAEHNLAIAYLYDGRVQDSSKLLEGLVERGHAFPSLTLNLATIMDLTSDGSRDKKIHLVNEIASQNKRIKPFMNADFKL